MKRSKTVNTVKEIKIDVIDNKRLLERLRKSEIFSDLVLYMERKINNTDKNIKTASILHKNLDGAFGG